ncbi:MAG TPA: cobalamin-binding protein [Steroidobacteraceae bacterium]|nr:cobalamin-binding protein [Steroidobacteraceae bacterium]
MSMRSRALTLLVLFFCAAVAAPAKTPAPAQRIVSLAPNLTELVFTVGAGERLVGADVFSNYPPQARAIARVGDAFQVDYERVLALDPDLVLVWDTGTPEPVIEKLTHLGLAVERISTTHLDDVPRALRRLGELTGTRATAELAAQAYTQSLNALRRAHTDDARIEVFYQISSTPLYTISSEHLISEIITLCGGHNIFADLEQLAPPVSREAVLERNPEVILAGDDVADDPFGGWRQWQRLRAVELDNLYVLHVDRIARATTRTVDGAREVCSVLDQARTRRAGARTKAAGSA